MNDIECPVSPRRWTWLAAALTVALAAGCKKEEPTENPAPPPAGADAQAGADAPGVTGPAADAALADSAGSSPRDGGSGGGDAPKLDAPAPPRDSAPPLGPPMTCGEIRNCVARCQGNAACATQCSAEAPMEEQMAFMTLDACSKRVCPAQDATCRCKQECLEPGECVPAFDTCTSGIADDFCDQCN
jgi:hypothetical protein